MPKAYSCDLRERVIEAVETGASRREGGRTFRGERELGGKMGAALARQKERRAEAARRKHFSARKVRHRGVGSDCRTADLTLVETVAELRKRRIRTSRSSLWRFLDRHNITLKKKPASRRTAASRCGASASTLDARAKHA